MEVYGRMEIKEIDAARHCQKKIQSRQRDWESCYRTWKRRTCEATPAGLVDEPKEFCTGARRTETFVTPRYVCSFFT